MMNSDNANTFWKLINEYSIEIPKLQRDYAQGRTNDTAIEQIRRSLIDELYYSLTNNSSIELNFIYGKTANNMFIPIDGQQRLTTLFLLHWYIFSQSSFTDGIDLLKKFSYNTRDTSRRFCFNLCSTYINFDKVEIDKQIRDQHWFTGNFIGDPTVKSMLVMLQLIHSKFKDEDNFDVLCNKLTSETCPITFLWLKMEDFQKPADLYIKMNARGKLLSDFEIFKAKLQKSKILENLLGPESDEKKKIAYISKYNNNYAEFFYQIFGDKFDNAMMDFFKSTIRDDYFCEIVKHEVSQKQYRDRYSPLREMNGNVFFSFVENGGFGLLDGEEKDLFESSINKADTLLERFSAITFPIKTEPSLNKVYYDEKTLFVNNYENQTLPDNIVRYALYAYLFKFNTPMSDSEIFAYSIWKRFVYNIVKNIAWGGHVEYVCQTLTYFDDILGRIDKPEKEVVLHQIAETDAESTFDFIKKCSEEESVKASLMIPAEINNVWYVAIVDAEQHFDDGQIGFLLQMSKKPDNNVYDIVLFNKYLELAKTIFTPKKQLCPEIDASLFEKAMLCMPDPTVNKTAHLLKQGNSTTTWGFLQEDFSEFLSNQASEEKMSILKSLLDILLGSNNYTRTLQDVVGGFDENGLDKQSKWKISFIKRDLFSVMLHSYCFKNCIHLSNNNEEVLLLTGTTVRAYSTELNTFLLYQDIKTIFGEDLSLVLDTTSVLYENDGFPKRHIRCGAYSIGYITEKDLYVVRNNGQDEFMNKNDVLNFLK